MMYSRRLYAFVLLLLAGLSPVYAQDSAPRVRSIEVRGEAMAEVIPDQAIITIGVSNRGDDPVASMNANSASIKRIISVLEAAGIAKADIRTSRLSLYPTNASPRYEAANLLTIRIRAVEKVDHILADLLKNGVNTIRGISFDHSDSKALERDLRIAAIRNAREKAEVLAQAAGASLGDILTITYSASSSPAPVAAMRAGLAAQAQDVPVEQGSITRQEEVVTVWQLK
jgi:uncharacterized protein